MLPFLKIERLSQIPSPGPSLLPACLCAFMLAVTTSEVKALDKTDDIDTNRPSFCQSAIVVPKGSLQLENGTLYQHFQHGLTYFDIPENQLRLGLTRTTEFQMFTPDFVLHNQGATTLGTTSGLEEVGIKQQLPPFKRLVASFVGGVNIPTGAKVTSGTDVQPVFRIPYAISLTKTISLCGMESIIITDSRGDIDYEPFVMVTKTMGRKVAVFAEYASQFIRNTHVPGVELAHFGGIYKLNRNNQLDMHFGFGLTKNSPAAFVGAGYSYRFDHLPWGK